MNKLRWISLALTCAAVLFAVAAPAATMPAGIGLHSTALGPAPPPNPWDDKVALGPAPPPNPWDDKVALGPAPPPNPWDDKVALGPAPPPNPWDDK